MKLSEQYERHINKLNEGTSVKAEPVIYTDKPTSTSPWSSDNAADPTSWIKYSALTLGALALIFGRPAMLKLFGRKFTNQEGKVTRYNIFKRLKDKKALRDAGITKEQMRDIWIKFQKQIAADDQKLMRDIVKSVKKGDMTANNAMAVLTHLVPKGAKNLQYRTLVGFEKIAAAKKANAPAVAAGFGAPVQAPAKTATPWFSSTITKPASSATAIVRGYTDPVTKIHYPNLSQKQVEKTLADKLPGRVRALKMDPNITWTELLKR